MTVSCRLQATCQILLSVYYFSSLEQQIGLARYIPSPLSRHGIITSTTTVYMPLSRAQTQCHQGTSSGQTPLPTGIETSDSEDKADWLFFNYTTTGCRSFSPHTQTLIIIHVHAQNQPCLYPIVKYYQCLRFMKMYQVLKQHAICDLVFGNFFSY